MKILKKGESMTINQELIINAKTRDLYYDETGLKNWIADAVSYYFRHELAVEWEESISTTKVDKRNDQ